MLAKLIVTAGTRDEALTKLDQALADTRLAGIETNLAYLRQVVQHPVFREGRQVTRFLSTFHFQPDTIEVLAAGVQTAVQDWPGRLGLWDVGVPPSGPMDALAHRLANRLVGNAPDAATLECTLAGPTLKFHADAVIALTGAPMPAELDGQPLALWQSHAVRAGSVLTLGRTEQGLRSYLAVGGGLDLPAYLGSRATFTLGPFGGHCGRNLRGGDVLPLAEPGSGTAGEQVSPHARPDIGQHWDIGVLYGPHGAPDFFQDEDIPTFSSADGKVHHTPSRTGVRLIGPKPKWARRDGGEAGLHPSNIHDNAYAIGAIDFTGDMPVILGPDGPSLGGFVCPAVVVNAELWKLGQLRPGDTVRFHRISAEQAAQREALVEAHLPPLDDITIPNRVVRLPLSWDDAQTRLAIEKYMQSVRPDAPWCPSNIEFIRRINGLDSIKEVFNVVFDASYLVLGLGDVYLGAPVATPVDPRHRLVTTKYNPARTWTPENAVGIGGAYMCVYGMEGPGGYQFVGRTLQMWNRWRHGPQAWHPAFAQPWLLRFFDEIRFHPVSEAELLRIRASFPHGGYALDIEASSFNLRRYRQFLAEQADSIAAFKARQQASFEAERERWIASGQADFATETDVANASADTELDLPEGGRFVATSVPGNVWQVPVKDGQVVKAGEVLVVVESMKMEFAITSPCDGTVHRVLCREGAPVSAGQDTLILIEH